MPLADNATQIKTSDDVQNFFKRIDLERKIKEKIINSKTKNTITSLLLLSSGFISTSIKVLTSALHKKIAVSYFLLGQSPINDTDAMIEFTNNLHSFFTERNDLSLEKTSLLLKNILAGFAWEDAHARQEFTTQSALFINYETSPPVIKKILEEDVRGISIENKMPENLPPFINLKHLNIRRCEEEKIDLSTFKNVTDIEITVWKKGASDAKQLIPSSSLNNLVIMGIFARSLDLSKCTNVKYITITSWHIESVTLPQFMPNLETLEIDSPKVERFDIPQSPQLKEISVHASYVNNKNGPHIINIMGPLPNLQSLELHPGVSEISGLEYCPQLDRSTIPASVTIIEKNELEKKLIALTFSLEKLKTQLKTLSSKLGDLKRGLIT